MGTPRKIGVVYDSLGRAEIVDVPRRPRPRTDAGSWWNPLSWLASNPDKKWLKRPNPFTGTEQVFAKSTDNGQSFKLLVSPGELTDDDKNQLSGARRVTYAGRNVQI